MGARPSLAWLLGIGLIGCCMSGHADETGSRQPTSIRAWAESALLGAQTAIAPPGPGLEVVRQDYGQFRVRQSVMNTPLRLAEVGYQHGLGTHAESRIVVRLRRPGKRFEAQVGVDNNYDTRASGAAWCSWWRSPGRRPSGPMSGAAATKRLTVGVELHGATEFVLRVLDAGDGPHYDQADWADAAVILDDDQRTWLDEMPLVARARA